MGSRSTTGWGVTPDPSWPPHIQYMAQQSETALDLARQGVVGLAVLGALVLVLLAIIAVSTAYGK